MTRETWSGSQNWRWLLSARDFPTVLAINVLGACLVIAGNLAADVAMTFADPRLSRSREAGDAR